LTGPHPSVAAVRVAVAALLDQAGEHLADGVTVACSGGADSLALAVATRFVAGRRDLVTRAVVVDHGLQEDSEAVAGRTSAQLARFDIDSSITRVVVSGPGGPEAAARRARYTALREVGTGLILLGHTLDDQAETVLLGLGRGSGPNSVRGMRPLDPPWGRPLLGLRRATTEQACRALGLSPWRDPHNTDPTYTRVRLRHEVLPLLEDVLRGGVAAALARTAAQVTEDHDALTALASVSLAAASDGPELVVERLAVHPAIRRRALREWLRSAGVSELTDRHLRAVDGLIGSWRGQKGVALPGGLLAVRRAGRLRLLAAT
jgi:tRNA(Ile)-lysidine synthase